MSDDGRVFRLDVTAQDERGQNGQENGEQFDGKLCHAEVIHVCDVEIFLMGVFRRGFRQGKKGEDQHRNENNGESDARDEQSGAFVESRETRQINSIERRRTKGFTIWRKSPKSPERYVQSDRRSTRMRTKVPDDRSRRRLRE